MTTLGVGTQWVRTRAWEPGDTVTQSVHCGNAAGAVRWEVHQLGDACWEEPLGPGSRFPAPLPSGATPRSIPPREGGAGNMARAELARQQGPEGGRRCPHNLLCREGGGRTCPDSQKPVSLSSCDPPEPV